MAEYCESSTLRVLAAVLVGTTALLVGSATPVDAATTQQVCVTHPLRTTEVSFASSLPKFDPALGTFQSATLSFSATLTSVGTYENTSAQAQTFTIVFRSTLVTTGPDGFDPALTVELQADDGEVTVPALGSTGYGPVTGTANVSRVSTDAARWAGAGTVDFVTDSLSGLTTTGGGGNIRVRQATSAGFVACVTFEYEPTASSSSSSTSSTTTSTIETSATTATSVASTTSVLIAVLPPETVTTTRTVGVLPVTGADNQRSIGLAAALVVCGGALLSVRRRPRSADS